MDLKLKLTPGLWLVGFMGSGKSTVGKALAERLGWAFRDLDSEIEAAEGTTISRIFETRGEEEFRRLEREALRRCVREASGGKPMVAALGGGAFAQAANRDLLLDHGVTIWLDCPFDIVRRRVALAAHRPLARDEVKFAELYETRAAAYAQADYRIPIDSDDPSGPVEAILGLPVFR
jgi:shikimate kinase